LTGERYFYGAFLIGISTRNPKAYFLKTNFSADARFCVRGWSGILLWSSNPEPSRFGVWASQKI